MSSVRNSPVGNIFFGKKIKEYENDLYSEEENYERDTSTEYNSGKDTDDDFDLEKVIKKLEESKKEETKTENE